MMNQNCYRALQIFCTPRLCSRMLLLSEEDCEGKDHWASQMKMKIKNFHRPLCISQQREMFRIPALCTRVTFFPINEFKQKVYFSRFSYEICKWKI